MHTKRINNRFIPLWFIIMSFVSSPIVAQTKCSNRILVDIYTQLEDYLSDDYISNETLVQELCDCKPIIIEKSPEGIINHIGVKLFERELIEKFPSHLYHFVERYILELLLLADNQDIINKMKIEHVKMHSDIHPMTNIKKGLLDICSRFSNDLSFSIICRNNRYFFSCIDNNMKILEISFPVRYELISGYTKLEAENTFYTNLLECKEKEYTQLNEKELFVYKDSLLCFDEDYYLTEDFISTSFYKKAENKIVPILSSTMILESVYNLFNAGYNWGVETMITQSLYGGKTLSFNFPLSKLIHFLNQQNCKIYTGIQKYEKNIIRGTLMAVNMELGYQHLMMFSLPKDLIDTPKENQIRMKIYSYIPIHNISSLFDNKSKIE